MRSKKEKIDRRLAESMRGTIPDFPNNPLKGQVKNKWYVDVKDIDVLGYFITSGEAVKKCDKLQHDLSVLAHKARILRDQFIKIRGNYDYLECTHEKGLLLIKRVNRRNHNPHRTWD